MGGVVLAGGWDLAKGRAKPLRRAMPPGSVFIFKDLEGNSIVPLDGICISGFSKEHLALQGFGLVVAGLEP